MEKQRKCLFLLDGNSLTHRAFYALPPMNTADGTPTNAAFGFTRMLLKLINDEKPDFLAVAFDLKAPTFRHKEFEAYKGTRSKTPDELVPQFEIVKDILRAFDIPIYSIEGYEADDVLGTLAKEAEKHGHAVTIVTGDRDALQLVSDNIRIMYNKRGITDIEDYTLENVRKKYEVEPIQLIDVKALMGDKSDNIPGVPGIGEKTAISLIKEFGSVDAVLDNIDQVSGKKRKENLENHKDDAMLSKRLATIVTDVPIDIDFDKCEMGEPNPDQVVDIFKKLDFRSLVDQFAVKEEINPAETDYQTITDEEKLTQVVHTLSEGNVNVDVILTAEDPMRAEIQGLVFSGQEEIYYLPLEKFDNKIPVPVQELLRDGKIAKTMYQAKLRMVALRRYGVELKGLTFDADLAVYLLRPSEKNPDWAEIVSEYLMVTLPEEKDSVNSSVTRVSLMNQLRENLEKRLEENQLTKLFKEVEIPLEEVLAEMEFNGIDLDEQFLSQLSTELGERIETITQEIYTISGVEFNVNSPKQLGEVLFEKLGMPVIKKTKTGYSTSAEVLEELGKNDPLGIIQRIHEYRELSKLKSTYVDALPPLVHPETGRIHTYFNQTVTATGRLSSTEPNLQNIPIRTEEGRKIRAAFVADKEKDTVLVTADYSQVELRILAHICQDPGFMQAFKENADIHARTAAEVFGVREEEVDKELRRRAKAINFGIAYGLSPFGLSRDLGISIKEAEDYINRYFTRYKGVKEYIDSTIELAKEQGYVTTLEGRRRYLPEINSRNFHKRSFAERMAINTPIQGSAADIMKMAMIKVYRALKEKGYQSKLLLQVHDELVLEVVRDELEEILTLVRREMEETYPMDVPLLVDVEQGQNWRDQA